MGVHWMVGVEHYRDVSTCPQHDLIKTTRMLCNELADIIHLVNSEEINMYAFTAITLVVIQDQACGML